MQYMMVGVDIVLRIPFFHGEGSKDLEHFFFCEAIWTVKNVQDDDENITKLEKSLRECELLWYMKY
jgi:hypothetical protein